MKYISLTVFALVIVAVIVLIPLQSSLADAQEGDVVYRAFIMGGNESYDSDILELGEALETPKFGASSTPWWTAVKTLSILGARWTQVRTEIESFFSEADENDISLILISTTGTKVDDGADKDDAGTGDRKLKKCKNLPCDEAALTTGDAEDGEPEFIRDDSFDDLFAPFVVGTTTKFTGPKIIALSTCYSTGLADGTRDLPATTSVVMMAAGTNEISHGQSPAFEDDGGDGHMWFPSFLINGLADDGGTGKARADANRDNQITVNEWFDYTKAKVEAVQRGQHPQKNFTKGSGDWIVLKYNDKTLIKHSETIFTGRTNKKAQCIPEGTIWW